ncbi:MAG: hypothetical protein R6U58_08760 [Bacteroidales bacterium]
MEKKQVFLIIIIQSVVIALLLIYLVFSLGNLQKIATLESELDKVREREAICIDRNDSLSLLLQEERITHSMPPFLDRTQVEELVKKGLSSPVEDLRDDLVSDPDLIGTSAVLGGRMGFYLRDGIHVLNKRWVFAYFEDGHMAGAILLRYDVSPDGGISWEVIDELIY